MRHNDAPMKMQARRRSPRILLRYTYVLLREFRFTLGLLAVVVCIGALVYGLAPPEAFVEPVPRFAAWPFLAAWMALFAEPLVHPQIWYVALVAMVFPLLGFALVGEGVVRLGMLVFSRKLGEKEWMVVMASTLRDHIVLCGLGHLGFRVLGQLLSRGLEVVVVERDAACPHLGHAREHGVPVLLRDMRDDQALKDAGIDRAKVVVLATGDDLGNVEVALDARRFNPGIKVVLRMFDQRIADKFEDAGIIDEAFSSAALAAPQVADLTMRALGPRPSATAPADPRRAG